MYILSNEKRYASTNHWLFLHNMRSLFPKYPMYLELTDSKKVEICNDGQLLFATKIVSVMHEHKSETELMEEEAKRRLLEPSSDEEEICSEEDMDNDFFMQIGFTHEYY
jgi:hypothetical protein